METNSCYPSAQERIIHMEIAWPSGLLLDVRKIVLYFLNAFISFQYPETSLASYWKCLFKYATSDLILKVNKA